MHGRVVVWYDEGERIDRVICRKAILESNYKCDNDGLPCPMSLLGIHESREATMLHALIAGLHNQCLLKLLLHPNLYQLMSDQHQHRSCEIY